MKKKIKKRKKSKEGWLTMAGDKYINRAMIIETVKERKEEGICRWREEAKYISDLASDK